MNGEAQNDRIRLAGRIAVHALEQLLREAKDGLGDENRTVLLAALYDDGTPAASVLGVLGDLITETGKPLPEGTTAEDIDEAAAYVQDYAGQRLANACNALTADRQESTR